MKAGGKRKRERENQVLSTSVDIIKKSNTDVLDGNVVMIETTIVVRVDTTIFVSPNPIYSYFTFIYYFLTFPIMVNLIKK